MTEIVQLISNSYGELPLLSQIGFLSGGLFGLLYMVKRKNELALLAWVSVIYALTPMFGSALRWVF